MQKPIISSDHDFTHDAEFDGMISGHATVEKDVQLVLSGMVGGDLKLKKGARVTMTGSIGGKITVKQDAHLVLKGLVGKSVINEGGQVTYI